jgi:hypothetical protein
MKVRNGFVSNSSSSSFIISTNADTPKLTLTISLDSIISTICTTKEQVDKFFLEEYGSRGDTIETLLGYEDNYIVGNYMKCLEAINNGKKVCFGDVSSEDYESISSFIYSNGFDGTPENFDIIQEPQ